MPRIRSLGCFGALVLAGCVPGNRGLESVHQPLVANGTATVPHCPDWSDSNHNRNEDTAANYGCAVNTTFAAMLADPDDLIHGRAGDGRGADADSVSRAVKAWRDTPPSGKAGIEKVSSKGGN